LIVKSKELPAEYSEKKFGIIPIWICKQIIQHIFFSGEALFVRRYNYTNQTLSLSDPSFLSLSGAGASEVGRYRHHLQSHRRQEDENQLQYKQLLHSMLVAVVESMLQLLRRRSVEVHAFLLL